MKRRLPTKNQPHPRRLLGLPVRWLLALLIPLLGVLSPAHAAVWQWSVPVPSLENRRAYLWISPQCRHVRGIVVACQNMLEEPLFERPAFRAAAAENDLALVLIFSGHDRGDDDNPPQHPRRSYLDIFLNPDYPHGDEDPVAAGADLQTALDGLARESGYPEIRNAPLMPVGHSSAGSFVWHLYRWEPSRIFAMMPFKTGAKDDGPQNIPILMINSQWFDYGNHSNNCSTNPGEINGQLRARGNGNNSLYGYYIDVGAGHCNVSDDSMAVVSMFLKKAVAARIPQNAPPDQPVKLKPVSLDSGWLIDVATLGKPACKAVAYADYHGDRKKAFWYLDRELAEYVQNHIAAQCAKKPQRIGFIDDHGDAFTQGGTYSFTPTHLDDAGTFRLRPTFIDHIADSDVYLPGTHFDHADDPILLRVNSGAVVQVGPDRFRICPRGGPLVPQGNPWEPTLVAYTLGNDQYQPSERPAHVNVSIFNNNGAHQTLDFPAIPNQAAGDTKPVTLSASASSGLPVEYFVISGPVEIDAGGRTMRQLPVPPQTSYPVRVLVAAYQWGRPNGPQVRSVGPVVREFFITQPGGAAIRPGQVVPIAAEHHGK